MRFFQSGMAVALVLLTGMLLQNLPAQDAPSDPGIGPTKRSQAPGDARGSGKAGLNGGAGNFGTTNRGPTTGFGVGSSEGYGMESSVPGGVPGTSMRGGGAMGMMMPGGMGMGSGRSVRNSRQIMDQQLRRQTQAIVNELRRANSAKSGREKAAAESVKASAEKRLRETLSQRFDLLVQGRERKVKELQKQLAALESEVKKWQDAKDEIVDLRLRTLLNEANGLGFPESQIGNPPSGQGFGGGMSDFGAGLGGSRPRMGGMGMGPGSDYEEENGSGKTLPGGLSGGTGPGPGSDSTSDNSNRGSRRGR